uniref:Uncharacterized protein n=1 Tax=Panagrolaimus superbus TaxID=310955 RepID=A0A914Y859_9BILA
MCQAVSFFGPAPLGRNLQLIDLLEYANLLDPEPEPLRVLPDPSSTTLPVNALNNIQERDLFGFFKFCSLIVKKYVADHNFQSVQDAERLSRVDMLSEAMVLSLDSLYQNDLDFVGFSTEGEDEGGAEFYEAGEFDFQFNYNPDIFPRFIVFSNGRHRESNFPAEEIFRHFMEFSEHHHGGLLPTIAESHREEELVAEEESYQQEYQHLEVEEEYQIPEIAQEYSSYESGQQQEYPTYEEHVQQEYSTYEENYRHPTNEEHVQQEYPIYEEEPHPESSRMEEYRSPLDDMWQYARPLDPQEDNFQPGVWNPRSRLFSLPRFPRY